MIYCVVPEALEDELFERLSAYYEDDPHVEVIVDRRAWGGKPGTHESFSDRRRQRAKGTFPPIDGPSASAGGAQADPGGAQPDPGGAQPDR